MIQQATESHPMTVKKIQMRLLEDHGELFFYDRRSIYRDIDSMIRVGLPVQTRYGLNNQREVWWVHG